MKWVHLGFGKISVSLWFREFHWGRYPNPTWRMFWIGPLCVQYGGRSEWTVARG